MSEHDPAESFYRDPLRFLDRAVPGADGAIRLPGGPVLLTEAPASRAVLSNAAGLYADHSDFFHTRRGNFGPREVQAEMGRTARAFLRAYLQAHAGELPAACLIYQLTRHPDWAARLEAELGAVPLAELCAAPTRAAPLAHRFVKETLRMWPSTPLVNRTVRTEIRHGGTCLRPGQGYLLSPDILHHDPRLWQDPDTFDPDRWLHGGDAGPCPAGSYVPFGWSPRTCIGAGLGTAQLILLCWLLSTRHRIRLSEPAAVRMALFSVPLPRGLRGTIERR